MIKLIFLLLLSYNVLQAQEKKKVNLYHPLENADSAMAVVQSKALNEGKQILVQIGGNWCSWCIEFNRFTTTDKQMDSILNADFVVYHLNYSKENLNKKMLEKFGFPQRFGFPVFIVIDSAGKLLHTQNSSYLEKDKSYSKEKVIEFLEHWNKKALDPKEYLKY
jgi:thioredoxin-related protein